MYHLTAHGRVRHTAESIGQGLLECLESKPMSAVTVSDIHNRTGVSRATFYRLFDAPEDVLLYLCDRFKRELLSSLAAQDFSAPRDLVLFSMRFAMEDHALLEVLVSNHRSDLMNDIHNATVGFLAKRFHLFDGLGPAEIQYTQSFFHSMMTATLVLWVQRGRQETPEQLLEYVGKYQGVMKKLFHLLPA